MTGCVFCPDNWDNLDIVSRQNGGFAILNPLNPVTEGHVLVISKHHGALLGEETLKEIENIYRQDDE